MGTFAGFDPGQAKKAVLALMTHVNKEGGKSTELLEDDEVFHLVSPYVNYRTATGFSWKPPVCSAVFALAFSQCKLWFSLAVYRSPLRFGVAFTCCKGSSLP